MFAINAAPSFSRTVFTGRFKISDSAYFTFETGPLSIDLAVLSSPFCKNILFFRNENHLYNTRRLVPLEGRIAIVTDAGRDAVDVEVPLTNGAEADGEVVWS